MKKYLLVVVFFFAFCASSFGQGKEPQDFFDWKINKLFSQLEKDRVPQGILLDYAMEFTNVEAFDGTLTDSTAMDIFTLQKIYNTLLMGMINNSVTGLISPSDFDTRLTNNRSADFIALTGLYFKYSKFKDDAVTSGKLIYEFRQADRTPGYDYIYDTKAKFYDKYVNAVWQNPYEEKQTFALTPAIKRYRGLEFKVKIPSAIFYTNSQAHIKRIEIDFDNGAGYRKVPFEQEYLVRYFNEGIKIWKYKLILTDGTKMYSQSEIKIEKTFKKIPFNFGIN